MCRHLGYIGKKERLDNIFLNKNHSLIDMAFRPKEMKNAKLNADGFGIGWNANNAFYLYKNIFPIWNDSNLLSIAKNLSSNLVLANVRSATVPHDLSYNNTHPFKHENILFSHNGYIKNFNTSYKEKMIKSLDSEFISKIKGDTDSEYLFYLFVQIYNKEKNILEAIHKTIKFLKDNCDQAMLNFLIAFKDHKSINLYATKLSINLISPSLYYLIDDEKNIYVSSEKLDDSNWQTVKDSSLLECNNNNFKIRSL